MMFEFQVGGGPEIEAPAPRKQGVRQKRKAPDSVSEKDHAVQKEQMPAKHDMFFDFLAKPATTEGVVDTKTRATKTGKQALNA